MAERDDHPTAFGRVFDKASDGSTSANTKLLALGEPGHESVPVPLGPQLNRSEEGMSGVSVKHSCQAK